MARIVSGIKPTGTPHLGNCLGMVRPALQLADHHDAYYFIADYHALNLAPDPADLRRRTLEVAATYLALGLDPDRTALYRQSDVPGIFELSNILAAVTSKGLLNRAHAYKVAVARNRELGRDEDAGINVGLYIYPLLMTADILALRGEQVPVGRDQQQHVDIARDIASAFNARYGPALTVPDAIVDPAVQTVPGTDGRKMSKSYDNTIQVLAPADTVRRQVSGIVTDCTPVEQPKDPKTDTVFQLFSLVAEPAVVEHLRARYLAGGLRYVDAKRQLADALVDVFAPARRRYAELLADPTEIEHVLAAGADRARAAVDDVRRDVRARIGVDRLVAGYRSARTA